MSNDQQPENPATTSVGEETPTTTGFRIRTLRERMWEPRFTVPNVIGLAVIGPLFAATIVWLAAPGMPWTYYLLETVDTGWFGPLVFLVIFGVMLVVSEFRQVKRAHYVLRGSSMLIGIAATRARHYEAEGRANAWDMGLHDVTNYLCRRVSPETLKSWETEVFEWYRTHPAAAHLPHPPQALHP